MAHYLNCRSAAALDALRKAGHEMEFVERLLHDMHAARAVLQARGRDPHEVQKFLATLRETLTHVQDNFELQMLDGRL